MRWSFKIGEFLGIGLYIHATFPLLLIFAALPTLMSRGGNITAALVNVAFVLALFVCVVLHEYGHAIAARRYGIRTADITLLPIGGVARLERMPEKPSQELVVAAAGPLVNVVIAALLFVGLSAAGVRLTPNALFRLDAGSFLVRLMALNVGLIVFNLIPAFPMDGGRILRALLALRMDYAVATRYAALLGQGIAVLFGLLGFFVNPLLVVTALFIFMGASQESSMVQSRSQLRGYAVGQAMRTNIRALAPNEWLRSAVDHMTATAQQDFPVVDNGRVVGLLTRESLIAGFQNLGAYTPVNAVMRRDISSVDEDLSLTEASEQLQVQGVNALPVTSRGMLVGMVTLESIREFMRMRAAWDAMHRPMRGRVTPTRV